MSTVLANTITAVGGGGSTVKVNNDSTYISDGGAVTDSNLIQGLVKVWCYWENSDTVRDSFNSSGLTDNGSGDATYSYTNNMANDDYASFYVGNGREYESPFGANSTSGQQTGHRNSSGTLTDANKLSGGILGDLA